MEQYEKTPGIRLLSVWKLPFSNKSLDIRTIYRSLLALQISVHLVFALSHTENPDKGNFQISWLRRNTSLVLFGWIEAINVSCQYAAYLSIPSVEHFSEIFSEFFQVQRFHVPDYRISCFHVFQEMQVSETFISELAVSVTKV